MKSLHVRQALGSLFVSAGCLFGSAAQAAYVYTEFSRPDFDATQLWDINNSGVMVGYSLREGESVSLAQGFIHNGSGFTSLLGPAGAISSNALGISDGGVVVGTFATTTTVDGSGATVLGPTSGYIYSGGVYTTFVVPGAVDTHVRGISPDGRYITGYYSTGTAGGIGFIYDRTTGVRTDLSVASSLFTIAQGVQNDGTVVGSDVLAGAPPTRPGFMYELGTGTRSDLSIAGVVRTALRAISEDDVLAGWFIDGTGIHGFVGLTTGYEQIDYSGATATFVEGMNNAKVLVGNFQVGDSFRAFIARPDFSTTVPLPATSLLVVLGLGALAWSRRSADEQPTRS
jgi:uncharacterized membrane protein